jgi:hypothetical protein
MSNLLIRLNFNAFILTSYFIDRSIQLLLSASPECILLGVSGISLFVNIERKALRKPEKRVKKHRSIETSYGNAVFRSLSTCSGASGLVLRKQSTLRAKIINLALDDTLYR